MNVYCPEGIREQIEDSEPDFFKTHKFYVKAGTWTGGHEQVVEMDNKTFEDPDPDFFGAILVVSEEKLIEYTKFEKTILYFNEKLIHDFNFKRFESIDGWFQPVEGYNLFKYIMESDIDGINVEIGSWKGKSSSWMSYASKLKNNDLICIDHFIGSPEHEDLKKNRETTFTEFVNNLRSLDLYDNVTAIASTSKKAKRLINEKIKLIFIDGNHDEFSNDLQYFEEHLVSGSIVAFHDCGKKGESGITNFMFELVDSGKYEYIGTFYTLGIIRRK